MPLLLALPFAPSVAMAANYALLIGVSNYTFKDITPLKGPANDVTLMWRALGKRGFSDVTVLADGLASGPEFPKSAGQPTRANILDAFAALGQRAKAGDLVLIYFSGHGTEQPVRSTNQDPERGNLDQVMLPIDAGGYDRATETVKNGIVDDEIGAALDKIRERGADVWMVDRCLPCRLDDARRFRRPRGARHRVVAARHSAGAARSAATRGTASKSSRFLTKPSSPNEGSLVEFFAVDSSREAIERSFDEFDRPMVGKGSDRRMGVFTYFLYRALTDSSGRIATYRDLAHHVVREMQQSQIAPPAMPTFGGALDRPLLSIGKAPPPAAWEVDARRQHGRNSGGLAARPDRQDRAQAVGVARAGCRRNGRRRPSAVPIRSARSPRSTAGCRPRGRRCCGPASPRRASRSPSRSPSRRRTNSTPTRAGCSKKPRRRPRVRGRAPSTGSAPRITPMSGCARTTAGSGFFRPTANGCARIHGATCPKLRAHPLTPSYPVASSASVGHVADALHKIARARNMVRLAEMADPSRSSNPWNALKVSAERVIAPGETSIRSAPVRTLNRLSEQELKGKALDLKLPEPVYHCDLVRITVRNTGNRDVDLNISYIDARAGIDQARPGLHRDGAAGRTTGALAVGHDLGPAEECARQRRPRARRDHGGRTQGRVADQPLLHPGGGARRPGCSAPAAATCCPAMPAG